MIRRSCSAIVVSLVAVALVCSPAAAGRRWCHNDPTFAIGGKTLSADAQILETDQSKVTGAIKVTLYVPVGTSASVIAQDFGFNGFGETVSIVKSSTLRQYNRGTQVRVEVSVPASRAISVSLNVMPAGGRSSSVTGHSNAVLGVTVTIPA